MPIDPDDIKTLDQSAPSPLTPRPSGARFEPGTLLASRYRIVSRVGKGGMGEVFRADDLVLGQSVALKFLPETARSNQSLLTRFYEEVRITREISHGNVCRVYDIGEADGQPFLSMEYIDGEDLGSLLRRIGRLPADKAAEFARKMCAGLAAAHAKGVLHRDLKPGNIMIDGRGQVRITDFGLATVTEQLQGPEVLHGTPAYMAPEQLAGREATAQSDIYALGLVLYEMFAGKRPHEADSPRELLRMREESQLTSPSSVIKDLDPAAERAILRCLAPDPKQRPASALDLARALPGGDPLAAALAAGETPSPEMVADSGSKEALRPAVAVALLTAFFVLLVAMQFVGPTTNTIGLSTFDFPPDALAAKAREIAVSLGYADRPADSSWGFVNQTTQMTYLQKSVHGVEAWKKALSAGPSPVVYWYRQSPAPIIPQNTDGSMAWEDPVPNRPGMLGVVLEMDGRLRRFIAISPQQEQSTNAAASTVDWTPLFAAAKLDITKFQSVEPQWTPLAATDTRAAWTGVHSRAGLDDLPIRVEAAAFRGKPVYFQVVWPWTTPDRERATTSTAIEVLQFVLIVAAIAMVWHNWKAGRGDVKGANQVAVFTALAYLATILLRAHHVGSLNEVEVVLRMVGTAAVGSVQVWASYLALEPWVRRYWPQSLIVWSRALGGRWRDPVLGRDVLVGATLGALLNMGIYLFTLISLRAGTSQPASLELMNLRLHMASILSFVGLAIGYGLLVFLMLFLARVLLRNEWLAAAVPVGLLVVAVASRSPRPTVTFTFVVLLVVGGATVALMRLGLLVAVVSLFTGPIVGATARTSTFTSWYGQGQIRAVSQKGRPLFAVN